MNTKLLLLIVPVATVVITVAMWEHGRMLGPALHAVIPQGQAGAYNRQREAAHSPDSRPAVIAQQQRQSVQPQQQQPQQRVGVDSSSPKKDANKPAETAVSNVKYNETQREHPNIFPEIPSLPDSDPGPHCSLAKGSWCGPYWTQPRVPALPVPRGDKECPENCNGVGTCNHDTGKCLCGAGWKGDDCTTPNKRPCFNMGPDKRDAGITERHWVHTRCSGLCDDDIGMCYCPPETKFGRQFKPDAKPGEPPLNRGRPMFWCNPNNTEDGQPIKWTWNIHTHADVLGPEGFCNAENPTRTRCGCFMDGVEGANCDQYNEMMCMNQCSGHGECQHGYCACHTGWYGHDCSRKKAGMPIEEVNRPWLNDVTRPVPAALEPTQRPTRKRPFIYVYDTDPQFSSWLMQVRIDGGHCVNRRFHGSRNESYWVGYYAYAIETVFHELMLTSEHRTFDPEEADYFYVPTYPACLHDIVGKAPRPFWPEDEDGSGRWDARPYTASMMMRSLKKWLSEAHPYWNRTGGADHIFLLAHDEAPCAAPVDIWNSIILSHWGRLDFPHGSNSSYGADNYSYERHHHSLPNGWLAISSKAHPCHDPEKHLVVPVFKQPPHYSDSIYLGGQQQERDILALFRGDMGLTRHGCIYSRCIRQTLWKLNKENNWREKHNIIYGDPNEVHGEYTQLLSRSKFCLVIPGDGWSARYEDAATHGCVPVIIMDNTLGPFEALIDYSQFSIRVGEHELHKLVDILLAVTPERLAQLQAGLARAWMRFRWNGLPFAEKSVHDIMSGHRHRQGGSLSFVPGMQWAQTADDDAFSTVIQWLHHRIPATRGKAVSQ